MASKGFVLKKLKHSRGQCLGDAVDLVDKEYSLLKSRLLNLIINRSHDLAHGVLRHRVLPASVFLFLNPGQPYRALACMMGDSISYQADAALPGRLLHDLGFTHSRRSHEKNRPLARHGDGVLPVVIF